MSPEVSSRVVEGVGTTRVKSSLSVASSTKKRDVSVPSGPSSQPRDLGASTRPSSPKIVPQLMKSYASESSDEDDPTYVDERSSPRPKKESKPHSKDPCSASQALSQSELSAAARNIERLKGLFRIPGNYAVHVDQFTGDNVPGHRPINRDGVSALAQEIQAGGLHSMQHPVIVILQDEEADEHFSRTSVPEWKHLEAGTDESGQPIASLVVDAGVLIDKDTKAGLGAGQHRMAALKEVSSVLPDTAGKPKNEVRWHAVVYKSGARKEPELMFEIMHRTNLAPYCTALRHSERMSTLSALLDIVAPEGEIRRDVKRRETFQQLAQPVLASYKVDTRRDMLNLLTTSTVLRAAVERILSIPLFADHFSRAVNAYTPFAKAGGQVVAACFIQKTYELCARLFRNEEYESRLQKGLRGQRLPTDAKSYDVLVLALKHLPEATSGSFLARLAPSANGDPNPSWAIISSLSWVTGGLFPTPTMMTEEVAQRGKASGILLECLKGPVQKLLLFWRPEEAKLLRGGADTRNAGANRTDIEAILGLVLMDRTVSYQHTHPALIQKFTLFLCENRLRLVDEWRTIQRNGGSHGEEGSQSVLDPMTPLGLRASPALWDLAHTLGNDTERLLGRAFSEQERVSLSVETSISPPGSAASTPGSERSKEKGKARSVSGQIKDRGADISNKRLGQSRGPQKTASDVLREEDSSSSQRYDEDDIGARVKAFVVSALKLPEAEGLIPIKHVDAFRAHLLDSVLEILRLDQVHGGSSTSTSAKDLATASQSPTVVIPLDRKTSASQVITSSSALGQAGVGLKGSESDTPQIKDSLRPEVSGAVALDQPAESSHLKRKRSAEGNGLSRLEKQIKSALPATENPSYRQMAGRLDVDLPDPIYPPSGRRTSPVPTNLTAATSATVVVPFDACPGNQDSRSPSSVSLTPEPLTRVLDTDGLPSSGSRTFPERTPPPDKQSMVESRESHLPERSRSPSMSKKSTPRSKRTPSHERPLSAPERSSDNPGPNHNDHATTITKAPNGSHAATREDASEVGSQSVDLQNPESSQTSEAPLSSLKLTKKGKERLLAERRQQESKGLTEEEAIFGSTPNRSLGRAATGFASGSRHVAQGR